MPTRKPTPPGRVAPMAPVALAVMTGVVVDRFLDPFGTVAWFGLAAGLLTLSAAFARAPRVATVLMLMVAASLAGQWHHFRWSGLASDDLARVVNETPRPVWLRGAIVDVSGYHPGHSADDNGFTRGVISIHQVCSPEGWRAASGMAVLTVEGDRSDLNAGSEIEAAGSLSTIAGPLNPGEFDYRDYLRAQGIRLRLSVDDRSGVWPGPSGAGVARLGARTLGAVRSWAERTLAAAFGPENTPLASALLLGRREGVDPDVNDAFARTGTTHLLAISGLHMQVLAAAVGYLLIALGVGRRKTAAVVMVATAGYALLVGLLPSVVRSAAMTLTACAAALLNRPCRNANTLSLAAILTLAHNPADLFDVGCQLSFLAVAVILWGVSPLTVRIRRWARGERLDQVERALVRGSRFWAWRLSWGLAEGLAGSAMVWLAALPLTALRFHLSAPIGVVLNLPLIPMTSAAMLASGISLALSAVWTPLGRPLAVVASWLLDGTEAIVKWGASVRWGHSFVAEPSTAWVLGFYGLLLVAGASVVGRWRAGVRRVALVALGVWTGGGLIGSLIPGSSGPLRAEVLAVGHGLAVVIETGAGHAWLYDCGRMRDASVGRRLIAPALWARGVHTLDGILLSHADFDHYGGLPDLLDRFTVRSVLVADGFAGAGNPAVAELLDLARSRGASVRTVQADDCWESGSAQFGIHHPPAGFPKSTSDNARSVVLEVWSEGRRLLLTGDLEQEGLAAFLDDPGPPADVFLAPHHGGRTSNPAALYDRVRPDLVVVSQRAPREGTHDPLSVLDGLGIPLLRTWERGAIRLTWEESGIAARGYLDPAPAPAVTGRPLWLRGLVAVLGFGAGLVAFFGLAVVESAAWYLVLPGRKRGSLARELTPDDEEQSLGTPIEAVAADGIRLAGLWHEADPSHPGTHGRTVLVLHGFAEDPSTLRGRMDALGRHGWNVAALDNRAHGRSGGDRSSFGGREAGDVLSWLDTLTTLGKLGPGHEVAVWGRSMGAAIAVRAVSLDPRIVAIVLESPYDDLAENLASIIGRRRVPFSGLLARRILRRAGRLSGVSLHKPSPIDLAPTVGVPVLVLHGSDDRLTPSEVVLRLARAFPSAEVVEVPGARHNDVVELGGDALLERVATFLDGSVAHPPASASSSGGSPEKI